MQGEVNTSSSRAARRAVRPERCLRHFLAVVRRPRPIVAIAACALGISRALLAGAAPLAIH